ncbi:MAG: DegT/DnrJ/EryC1/StrS family aminotransferase [Acidobacteria bacterium]|nr:DegT/DnrJ/EryC1/StrS family aminotransferase [Acidobacteriota bacterium]
MKKTAFLNLTRHSNRLLEETSAAVRRVLERGHFILGEEVAAFETEWARYCGARGAVGVANGTDAITLALTASGAVAPGRGDEVLTTPLTAGYTALGILNAGARPVFVDVDERSLNLDPEKIEAAITPRTRAVLPVHLYGQPAAMEKINEIAARRDLTVIEDAAQAHGARCGGKACGAASLAATYSFYPTKNLGAFGDGGAIVANDADFLERARILRQGGHREAFEAEVAGRNSRLDELQAAILRVKLQKLDAWTARRRELAAIYFEKLKNLPRLTLPANDPEAVFHLFVVRHPERDRLRDFLAARGVETLVHYPYLLHEQKLFRGAGQKSLPVAEKAVGEILSLPLYPELEDEEIETVCAAIAEFEG